MTLAHVKALPFKGSLGGNPDKREIKVTALLVQSQDHHGAGFERHRWKAHGDRLLFFIFRCMSKNFKDKS